MPLNRNRKKREVLNRAVQSTFDPEVHKISDLLRYHFVGGAENHYEAEDYQIPIVTFDAQSFLKV